MDVTSHFYHPSGVKQIELSVNGSALRTDPSPDTKSDFVFITQKWSPPAPGEYRLSVRAQSNGGDWGDSATAAVTVGEVVTVTPTIPARPTTITVTPPTRVITSTVVTRTNTPAIVTRPPTNTSTNTPQLPTRPPTNTPTRSVPTTVAPPVSTGPTFGSPSASRTLFYNIAGCGSTEVTINIAVNDSVSMTRVIISYRVGIGATQTQTMSNTTNNLWSKTLRGGQEVPTTPTGTLTYSITATNSQGKSATSPNYNLTYSNCKP
ncbi:MAG: hypothetical protein HZB17_04960 [Chloroflexi bacterium]|nr:hypothetical protein [Chloroflexota bacterium]